MPVESLKMTQVKQIQSISNTSRMVKVLLQAHEVQGLYCAQMQCFRESAFLAFLTQ